MVEFIQVKITSDFKKQSRLKMNYYDVFNDAVRAVCIERNEAVVLRLVQEPTEKQVNTRQVISRFSNNCL